MCRGRAKIRAADAPRSCRSEALLRETMPQPAGHVHKAAQMPITESPARRAGDIRGSRRAGDAAPGPPSKQHAGDAAPGRPGRQRAGVTAETGHAARAADRVMTAR
jgi:hypothetical protein